MSAIDLVISGRKKDLGGFEVSRVLPYAKRRTVGPFIFWDEMGPGTFAPGKGMDVRPHPHIGLATVTYLFQGQIMHRDSLGTHLPIEPGAVNWMTAGKGIVHSERTAPEEKAKGPKLFGIQTWVALPASDEETDPSFSHTGKGDLPFIDDNGATVRVILGSMYGKTAPVKTFSPMFYGDVVLPAGKSIPLDSDYEERAVYIVSGDIEIAGDVFEPGNLLVFKPGDRLTITAQSNARFMLLGGDSMDGPRHIWWNFVSSRKERIDQAKEDWKQKRFDTVPGDEEEFIPLPEIS